MVPEDRSLEAFPLDEPHGVFRPTVVELAQAINGDNARVFEPAGDLRLSDESLSTIRVMRGVTLDSFECDIAVKFFVSGEIDGSQPPLGVKPENPKSLARRRGRFGFVSARQGQGVDGDRVGVLIDRR